jgi:hypothetical protein
VGKQDDFEVRGVQDVRNGVAHGLEVLVDVLLDQLDVDVLLFLVLAEGKLILED